MATSAAALEKLVVRLMGDATQYEAVLKKAEADIKSAVAVIDKAAKIAIDKQNDALQQAARVTEAVRTPTERYKETIKELDKLLKAGLITQQTYNRAEEEASKILPEVVAAQAKVNNMLRQAEDLTEKVMTTEEQYARELDHLNKLMKAGYITQQTYNRGLGQLNTKYKDLAAAAAAVKVQAFNDKLNATNKVLTGIQGNLQQVSSLMKSMGTAMTVGITAPVLAGGAFSVHEFAKFEQALDDMTAAAKPTASEIALVQSAAMQLSKELRMDPTPIVSTFNELLKAGMSVEEVLGGAGRSAAQFARVGELETATAAVIMADSMEVFGEKAARTGDLLSSAADASSTSIRGIAEAFSQASAVAGGMGKQTLEDTAAAIAILANQGIKGSDAGTSLKTMFIALAAPTKHAQDVIDKYSLAIRDADGRMRPLAEIAQELKDKLGGLGDEARDAALKHLLGNDALRAGIAFMKKGAAGVNEMKASMATANSVAEKYKIVTDNLNGTWNKIVASFKRAAITLGGTLAPTIEKIGTVIANAVDATAEWMAANPEMLGMVATLLAMAAAAGPLLVAVGSIVGGIAGLVGIVAGFVVVGWEAVLLAAAITAGLVLWAVEAAVVAAAVAGIVYWLVGGEGISYAFSTALEYGKMFFMGVVGFIANWKHNWEAILAWLPNNWHLVLLDMLNMTQTVFVNMMKNIGVAFGTGVRIFTAFAGWWAGMAKRAFSVDMVNFLIDGVKKAAVIFSGFAEQAWKHLKAIFSGKKVSMSDFIDQLGKDFEKGAENINFADTVRDIIREDFQKMHNPLEGFESSLEKGPNLLFDLGKKEGKAFAEGIEKEAVAQIQGMDEGVFFGPAEEMSEKAIKALAKARSGKGHGGKPGKDEGVFFDEPKLKKEKKAIKDVEEAIKSVDAAVAGSSEALARLEAYRAMKGADKPDMGIPGGLGLEPKAGLKGPKFAEGDMKVVAAMADFNKKDTKDDKLLDAMNSMVEEIKIQTDLEKETTYLVVEPLNL